jgi:dodecin
VVNQLHKITLVSSNKGRIYGKKDKDSVYKVVEVVGTSKTSWAEAGRKAVEIVPIHCVICG